MIDGVVGLREVWGASIVQRTKDSWLVNISNSSEQWSSEAPSLKASPGARRHAQGENCY